MSESASQCRAHDVEKVKAQGSKESGFAEIGGC